MWRTVGIDVCKNGHARRVHVYPVFPGEREHEERITCWCDPEPDPEEPRVIIHKRKAEA